ncbi:MAG: prepilin-type N-terminal cleavage/methylation domain-containing protein [Candidatus Falkowbacteria bacterium]|nr:prepilin-type N-terminal cleavage/methylation domain-containing protein [Candidatus Falkowbacteria bacterium]
MRTKNTRGFTLIELLIVIAIIAILAAAIFVALDPLRRFKDTRDARRWADTSNILNAIKVNQVDLKGYYLPKIESAAKGKNLMIGTATGGCDTPACAYTPVTSATDCIDLTGLVNSGYLGLVPINPGTDWTSAITGYTLMASTSGAITIAACDGENYDIKVVR